MLHIGGSALGAAQDAAPAESSAPSTLLPHRDTWWWLSGQVNLISQAHGTFTSPYAGDNSFRARREQALSRVWTVYTGIRLPRRTEVLVDVESAGGRGLSDALGLAGFTNLDVVRNPTLGTRPYVARALVHVTLPLSTATVDTNPTPLSLATRVPARRIEFRLGKLGMADFFDINAVGSDSHLQFTNWTVDNNGAYDYAADTRGYTDAFIAEYDTRRWSVRFGEALMPTVANGIHLDWHITQSRAENVEFEIHPTPAFTLRLLAFANHANMGRYDVALEAYQEGQDAAPDVAAHRRPGRVKSGVGLNVEYVPQSRVRAFARTGWNEGRNESFAYTEVNDTAAIGADLHTIRGPQNRLGVAFVSNGLSSDHREYLQHGGYGFLLGDGTLRYGREDIVETYYAAHLWRGVSASAGLQWITHPGYNRDRGPVLVEMIRMHADF